MPFNLSALPYPMDALEPFISRKTVEFHYTKHHQAYVNNLNKLTEGNPLWDKSLEEVVITSEGGIFNNAAQVWNHTFYWESFIQGGKKINNGPLLDAINKNFGSFEECMEKFVHASVTLFGSGWSWLIKDIHGELTITQGANAWNPLKDNNIPLLTCDVWEHAYYLDYQNRRPDYLKAFSEIIDWGKVEERFLKLN
jgi:superoxide dismutase, Fe-Mn family